MKICGNCKQDKELSGFYLSGRGNGIYRNICKKCFGDKYPYKITEQGRENWRKYKRSPKGVITCLLNNASDRAKKKGIAYELDYKWLEEKILHGKCEMSAMSFSIEFAGSHRANPLSPSIDKINPIGGYTKDNCRVICFCVNMAMSDWGEDNLYLMCDNLLKNRKLNQVNKALTWKD